MMRAVIFGTAGHIDHGKTSLVAALTGVDCDRLPEEKRRGITLVLGFAPLADPNGELEVSFIDVPGHERLVHTMIAGAGGIDRALLVVAADEGVMPQTREHVEILDLLGVRGGVVALNKCDLLEEDLIELQEAEVRERLAKGPLAGAPIVRCSATTGAGIETLRAVLFECARSVTRSEERYRPFRLGIDRVFTMPGAGTVVTGTSRWGEVRVGDELVSLPSGVRARVRGLQVHGSSRSSARAGERVALQLAGVKRDEVRRGEQLLADGEWPLSRRIVATLSLLPTSPAIEEGDQIWLHLLAGRTLAKVERLFPRVLTVGQPGRVVLRLAHPTFVAPGDRLVLRVPSPPRTVGGGRVLDPRAPRLSRRAAAHLADLPDPVREPGAAVVHWVEEAGILGASLGELAGRLAVREEGLESTVGELITEGRLQAVRLRPPRLLAATAVQSVIEDARRLVSDSGPVGIPVAELLSRIVPPQAERLREHILHVLRASGVLREVAGRALAAQTAPLEDELAGKVEGLYRDAAFAAPSPAEAAAALGAHPKTVEGMVRFLIDGKRLVRVGGKWVLHREVLDELAASVRAWGVEVFDVGQFKDRFKLTRKLAIPVLEWLDSARITRREADKRRVLPARSLPLNR